ncbi:MAG: tRNA 2-thiocytidine(32) synthetase TtcA [Clostridia bacterium]|nr:tRNA 2-thiocytidine(32) synthetase TtcA [Clostridia bacterium]
MTTQQMLSPLRRGIETYKLIKDGDRIAVGVSGGKDSVTLLTLLAEYKRFSPEKFDLAAISVDLKFGGEKSDYTEINALCEKYSVPFYVVETDIGEIVFDVRKEKNPCALCSKMRKGALYDKAKELGYNKVALGHHADDFIDTFMLSLFYEGRLSTFAPKSFLSRTGLTMIRPMIFIKECDVKSFSETLPVKKSRCPADKDTKRTFVKETLKKIGEEVPNIREMIFTALTHPERYNLFDRYEKETEEI